MQVLAGHFSNLSVPHELTHEKPKCLRKITASILEIETKFYIGDGNKIQNHLFGVQQSIGTEMNDVGSNRKWEIQNGGLRTGGTNISVCRQERNKISTAISMFSESSYPIEGVVILIYQTGNGKFKEVSSKFQLWPPSWISHFRFRRKLFQLLPLDSWTPRNIGLAVEIFFYFVYKQSYLCVTFDSGLEVVILIFYFRSGQNAFP